MALCSGCGLELGPGDEVIELSHDSQVHSKCFKCNKCGTQLSSSDTKYQADISHGFTCKDHRNGGSLTKQFKSARKSFSKAMKNGLLIVNPTNKKSKSLRDEGATTSEAEHPVPTPKAGSEIQETDNVEQIETSIVSKIGDAEQADAHDASVSEIAEQFEVGEFETVLVDNVENNEERGEQEARAAVEELLNLTQEAPNDEPPTQFSLPLTPGKVTPPLRHNSTSALSSPSVTSPRESNSRLSGQGDVASIMQTVVSTVSNAAKSLREQLSSDSAEKGMEDVLLSQTPNPLSKSYQDTSDGLSEGDDDVVSRDAPTSGNFNDSVAVSDFRESEDDISPESQSENENTMSALRTEKESILETSEGHTHLEDTETDFENEEGGEQTKQLRAAADPLNMLTTAVARELEVLPQGQVRSAESESAEEEEPAQPWVYPPAFSGVSPVQISVVDPDHLWMFLEGPLLERMAHSKVGGAKRARFIASEALKPNTPPIIYSRYRTPYLHMYLVKCDSLQEYTGTVRQRLRAFKEDVERREDPEWLLVLIESVGESKKVFEKIKQDFGKERSMSIRISEDAQWLVKVSAENADGTGNARKEIKLRRALDGQWGDLAQRVGTCIVRAFEHRRPIYEKSIREELEREMDYSYFNVFIRMESLAFTCLQCDRFEDALDLYVDLNIRFKRGIETRDPLLEKVVKCGMTDDSGSSVRRLQSHKLLFPAVSQGSTEQDAIRAHIHRTFPARIFDVERLPFRDLIGTSTVSGVQLQMYLMSRIVLCMLAIGRAKDAVEASRQFVMALRNNLRAAYPSDWTIVDAWLIAASLEIVAAGHACASVFAAEVDPADRVGMCLAQALLLERARAALEDISRRETKDFIQDLIYADKFERCIVPALALKHHAVIVRETNLPPGLARAFFSSPESFRNMYSRLLEASAAHFVAAGRFRFAAALTHTRAMLLLMAGSVPRKDAEVLFEDAGRWWGGGPRTMVSGEGTADVNFNALHDDWPSLKTETSLFSGRTDRVSKDVKLIQPKFRRMDLASKMFDEMESGFLEDALLPIEVSVEDLPSVLTEDDPWRCRFKLRFKLEELAEFGSLGALAKCIVRFKSQNETFFKDVVSVGEIDGAFFDAETAMNDANEAPVGAYVPSEAFVHLAKHPNVRLRILLSTPRDPVSIKITERGFPFECHVEAPAIIAGGTRFEEGSGGENAVVAERQELVLILTPTHYPARRIQPPLPECEALIMCSDPSVELTETKDGKISSPCLRVRFDCQTQRKFSLVVSSAKAASTLCRAMLLVDVQTVPKEGDTSQVRKAPRFKREIAYVAPIKVAQEVRLGGGDGSEVACVTLAMENNVGRLDHPIELVGCHLTSVPADALNIQTSPIKLFPTILKPLSPLRQTFIIKGIDDLVPNRVGGRSLMLLQASLRVRFHNDMSECTLQWNVPLVIARAEVVRTRWKEGEAVSFSRPALESARFGIDWKKLDEDTEAAPVIAINDDVVDA